MEWHEDLENVCQQAGLKGKKLSKVFYFNKIAILIIMSSYFPMAIIIGSKLENLLYLERLITLSFNKFLMVCPFSKDNFETWVELWVFFCLQAMENFSWNIRVLKGQADLLNQAKKESQEYLRQVSYILAHLILWFWSLCCPGSLSLTVHLAICLFICLSICLSVCLSLYQSVNLKALNKFSRATEPISTSFGTKCPRVRPWVLSFPFNVRSLGVIKIRWMSCNIFSLRNTAQEHQIFTGKLHVL